MKDLAMNKSALGRWMLLALLGLSLGGCGGGDPTPHRVATPEPEGDKSGTDLGRPFEDLSDRMLFRERSAEQTTIDALASIGEPAVPALVAVLKDPDPLLRQNAARALARMGPAAEPAMSELIAALQDNDAGVRKFATRALGEIGPPASKAVPALVKELRLNATDTERAAKAAATHKSESTGAPPSNR